jgi:hypothetical protein
MHFSRNTSRTGSRARALALLLAVLACAGALPAHAECPANYIKNGSASIVQSSAPAFDVPLGEDFGSPVDIGYDLAQGRLHEHSFAGIANSSWVRVGDFYDVTGVPEGTMIVATAELAVSNAWVGTGGCGGTGCWGYVVARIVSAQDSTERSAGINVYNTGKVSLAPFSTVLGVAFTAGTPIPLTFRLEGHQTAGGSHATDADATIRFQGLPPGASVVSCQGFVDPSTPAVRASWGRIKVSYR